MGVPPKSYSHLPRLREGKNFARSGCGEPLSPRRDFPYRQHPGVYEEAHVCGPSCEKTLSGATGAPESIKAWSVMSWRTSRFVNRVPSPRLWHVPCEALTAGGLSLEGRPTQVRHGSRESRHVNRFTGRLPCGRSRFDIDAPSPRAGKRRCAPWGRAGVRLQPLSLRGGVKRTATPPAHPPRSIDTRRRVESLATGTMLAPTLTP